MLHLTNGPVMCNTKVLLSKKSYFCWIKAILSRQKSQMLHLANGNIKVFLLAKFILSKVLLS